MMRGMLRTMAVLAASVLAVGCAITEDKVPIDYVPATEAAPLPGAAGVTLTLSATDARQQRADRISTKRNGYGMEMARIVSTNDVVVLVKVAIEREFRAEGFGIGPGGLAVGIELQNFYNNFKNKIMSGDAEAEVAFGIKVRDATGALIYSQFYSASAVLDVQLASGSNAKAALEKALTAAVKQVADDKALQQALLSTLARPSGRSS